MRLNAALTYGQMAFRALERYPDRIAFKEDRRSLTYKEAAIMIGGMQRVFEQDGLGRGERLLLLSANRGEAWCAGIAAQGLGLTLSYFHPLASLEEHIFLVKDANPAALVIDAATYEKRGAELREVVDPAIKIYTFGKSSFGNDLLNAASEFPETMPKDISTQDDFCTLLYTGGTTGRAKGVLRRQSAYSLSIAAILADFEIPDRVQYLLVAPMSHVAGAYIIPTLVKGGTIHCQRGYDPNEVLKSIERDHISMTLLVPTMIYKLLDHPDLDEVDTSSLELLLYGGAPMSPSRLLTGLEKFGKVFCQLYGQSEVFPITSLSRSDHDPARPELFASCGYPSISADIRILDDAGHEVPVREVGEICIRSPFGIELYNNLPEKTAETLQHGWLHTGDIAYRNAEGYFFIVDRKKDMIVTGGFNVYPRAVEDVIMAHPAVALVAVIGIPNETWGEAVIAEIVLRDQEKVSADEIKAMVKEKLGPVQTPKIVNFLTELPLTAIGKVDKKVLRKKYWGGSARQVG